jgi:hypothetical protein
MITVSSVRAGGVPGPAARARLLEKNDTETKRETTETMAYVRSEDFIIGYPLRTFSLVAARKKYEVTRIASGSSCRLQKARSGTANPARLKLQPRLGCSFTGSYYRRAISELQNQEDTAAIYLNGSTLLLSCGDLLDRKLFKSQNFDGLILVLQQAFLKDFRSRKTVGAAEETDAGFGSEWNK